MKVFVSYRREDSDLFAGRLVDRLKAQYGPANVFMDVDSTPLGADFRRHITETICNCGVVLAIIGPKWASQDSQSKRRIDDDQDFVRIELETALQKDIPIVPVLIGDSAVPDQKNLPPSLEALAYRNGTHIDPGQDFHLHTNRLIDGLKVFDVIQAPTKSRERHVPISGAQREEPAIMVASGPSQGEFFKLSRDRVIIGRSSAADISFDAPAMSRYHAQFARLDKGYAIEDLGTANGTYVNGNLVPRGERRVLSYGDHIHTGAMIFVYLPSKNFNMS